MINRTLSTERQPSLFALPSVAPRLHAFLTYHCSVLSMPRPIWEIAKPPNGKPVILDLGTMPLQNVSEPGVHAVAERIDGTEYRVSIYRPDAKDAARGYPINADRYLLWEGFPSFLDLSQIVNMASTGLDANVERILTSEFFC